MPRRWSRCAAASALLVATGCPILNPAWQESGTEGSGSTAPTSDPATTATQASATTETSTTAVDPTATATSTTSGGTTTTTTTTTSDGSTTDVLPDACGDPFPDASIHFEIPGKTGMNCSVGEHLLKAYATSSSGLDICAGACDNQGCSMKLGSTELPASYGAPLTISYCYDLHFEIEHNNLYEAPCRLKRLTAFDPINFTIPTIIASATPETYLDPMSNIPLTVAPMPDGDPCGCQLDAQCCESPPGLTEPHKLTFTSNDGSQTISVGGSAKLDMTFGGNVYPYKALNLRSVVRNSLVYPELDTCNQYQYFDWIMLLQ